MLRVMQRRTLNRRLKAEGIVGIWVNMCWSEGDTVESALSQIYTLTVSTRPSGPCRSTVFFLLLIPTIVATT
jgi:hypothetical protein